MYSLFIEHTTCVIFASFHQGKEEIIIAFLFHSKRHRAKHCLKSSRNKESKTGSGVKSRISRVFPEQAPNPSRMFSKCRAPTRPE